MHLLSDEQRKVLAALGKLPDEKIDFSDIPEIREVPSDRVVGKFYQVRMRRNRKHATRR